MRCSLSEEIKRARTIIDKAYGGPLEATDYEKTPAKKGRRMKRLQILQSSVSHLNQSATDLSAGNGMAALCSYFMAHGLMKSLGISLANEITQPIEAPVRDSAVTNIESRQRISPSVPVDLTRSCHVIPFHKSA